MLFETDKGDIVAQNTPQVILKTTSAAVLMVVALSACSTVEPRPYGAADLLARGQQDQVRISANVTGHFGAS
ncbi:MAG: hypothetical protein Q8K24_16280 [Hydrogenophaga sp.]|nr:hypothetical protein [Hydrogenophaga sp.]